MNSLKTLQKLTILSLIGLAFFSCKKNSTLTPASATAPVSFSVKALAGATSLAAQVDSAAVNYGTLSSIITTLDVYVYPIDKSSGVSLGNPLVINQTAANGEVFGLITPKLTKGQPYLLVFVGVNAVLPIPSKGVTQTPAYMYKGSFLPTGDTFLVSYASVNPPADFFAAVVHYTPSSNAAAPPQQVVLQRSVSKVTVTLTDDNLSPGAQFPMQLTLFNGAKSADLISGAGTLSTTTTSQVVNFTVKGTQNTYSAFFWPAVSQPKLKNPLTVYLTIHAGNSNSNYPTKTLTLPGNQLLPNTEYKFSGSVLTADQPNSFVTGADTTWNTQQGTFMKRIIKF